MEYKYTGDMMPNKYDIESSEQLINEAFRESQRPFITSYVKSLVETEDFSKFSKYTRGLVIEYCTGFLNRLVSQIWLYFSGNESSTESFFAPMSVTMSRQLTRISNDLLARNLVSDLMSESAIRKKLDVFFNEYEDRAEFKKTQTEYIKIKNDFETIIELTEAFRSSGRQMINSAEKLLETYLKYKEEIFKGMGFDVVLEYYDVDNFSFIYRDERLQNATERNKYELIAMNTALKAMMPGYDGDISNFAKICEDLKI